MKANPATGQRSPSSAFGHHLRSLRGAADMTQEELAERATVSARLISDLERGVITRPRRDTIRLLGDALNLHGADRNAFVALARGRDQAPDAIRSLPPGWPELPTPPTPIVGRTSEIAEVTALLMRPDVRLLTLTGPGGVGKTRLGLAVAAGLASRLADSACFIDLAPWQDPALVIPTIAQALNLRPEADQSPDEALHEALRDRQTLLLLDNFERLVAAAPEIAKLLSACPGLSLLVTSRKALHIRAEWEYLVDPLGLPDGADLPHLARLAAVPAVELFVARASASNRHFALTDENARSVAAIAVRLEGLPLALELAAARVKVLAPADLLGRLQRRLPLLTDGARDLPPRQQTMRATIGWSHDLLNDAERHVFRCLAVFSGGCTIEAIEAVAGCDRQAAPSGLPLPATVASSSTPIGDVVVALHDHGLVRMEGDPAGGVRFSMLETIREYGLDCLAAAGDEIAARGQHLLWHMELAERAAPELVGSDQKLWFDRLLAEDDNLRAAFAWAIERGDADAALRLGGALYRFWATNGLYHEGRRWLDQALAIEVATAAEPRAHALLGAGVMDYFLGDYRRASSRWHESLARFQALGHSTGVAYSCGNLGLVAEAEGDYPQATAFYRQALAQFRDLDDRTHIGFMLHNLGLIATFDGDNEKAGALFEEALAVARERGDSNSIAMTLGNLGLVALAKDDLDGALALQRQALEVGRSLGNRPWLVKCLESFGQIWAASMPERAAHFFGAASALRAEIGAAVQPNDQEVNDRFVTMARSALAEHAFDAAYAVGQTLSLDDAVDRALSLSSSSAVKVATSPDRGRGMR